MKTYSIPNNISLLSGPIEGIVKFLLSRQIAAGAPASHVLHLGVGRTQSPDGRFGQDVTVVGLYEQILNEINRWPELLWYPLPPQLDDHVRVSTP